MSGQKLVSREGDSSDGRGFQRSSLAVQRTEKDDLGDNEGLIRYGSISIHLQVILLFVLLPKPLFELFKIVEEIRGTTSTVRLDTSSVTV